PRGRLGAPGGRAHALPYRRDGAGDRGALPRAFAAPGCDAHRPCSGRHRAPTNLTHRGVRQRDRVYGALRLSRGILVSLLARHAREISVGYAYLCNQEIRPMASNRTTIRPDLKLATDAGAPVTPKPDSKSTLSPLARAIAAQPVGHALSPVVVGGVVRVLE